ncbi:Crp/Fnr family transcriptional regulator [Ideonella oryzae]|uniref:Helix-turn-helix domain-containing protein n=1 Tax=Ideonella oryzae TaxID=2937441 RepID=A0ABT1BMQ1_9BURK|nr:helix-turn-helix domain-containing protein [Ideonella oryzae]MCO5977510.1 helix-turn-helix domain-containing protein [Ideonella oryzae]
MESILITAAGASSPCASPDLPVALSLPAGDTLASPDDGWRLWRLTEGALRLDRLDRLDATGATGGTFIQLLLPGDLVGLEHLTGAVACYRARALVASRLQPVPQPATLGGWPTLAEALRQQQCRGEDLVRLRSGTAQERFKHLLLLLVPEASRLEGDVSVWPLPTLKDMAAIIDTAPETVSRILGHLRRQHLLDDRQRQVASFSPTRLREVEWPTGMTRTDRNPRQRRAADAWAA